MGLFTDASENYHTFEILVMLSGVLVFALISRAGCMANNLASCSPQVYFIHNST